MSSETVKVMVRCRPMNSSEIQRKCGTCVQVDIATNQITLVDSTGSEAAKVFTYDYVFQQDILQQTVYENSAFPLVESVVEGYNGTIFAYGQTGCGKTHSMLGLPKDEVQKGIIPRSFSHIINIIESTNDKKFLVRCSYIEIYNEEIRDLLGKDVKAKMDLKESPDKGVFVKDLTMVTVKTVAEMEKYMNIGTDNRSVGATKMNSSSSRSHSLFTLCIECSYIPEGQTEEHYTAGKLNLVDLAGSERQSKTEATGDRLKEATKINLSLSALGNVISALVDGKSQHIPYRDSKLTRLLQDSLGGNTKTIMLAAVSPADYNYDETLSTLRYAARAKNIKNQPKVNQDPKDAQLKEYADEIKKLKEMLMQQQAGGGGGNIIYMTSSAGDQPNLNKQISQSNQSGKVQSEKELKQLQEKNEALDAERRKMEEQMKSKDMQFQEELKEKERIRQMLQELEMKMVVGGTADQEKKKKVSQMRSKLKKQMAEHEKMTAEMERKEEDFLFLENKYSSLQEELDATKKIARKLRAKLKQQQSETKDFQRETEMEKGDLLDTIRYQERELKIMQTIALMLLTADEIEIIKSQGEWTDDYMTYKLPPFYFKQKKLNFPKLPVLQAQDLINQEKELREVEFQFNSKDNRSSHNNNNQNSYPQKSSSNNSYGTTSKGQQLQNGYQNNDKNHGKFYNQNDFSPFGNDDTRGSGNGKYQQSNNRYQNNSYANNGNGNGNGNGYKNYRQDDTDSLPDSASIKSISDSRKDNYNHQSPALTNKKNSHKASIPDKARITNVSLDPIDSRLANQKLSGLQDTLEASFYSEQPKIPLKNVQLQPISNSIRPPASQSLGGLNTKQYHNQSDSLDPLSQKPSNKIKLDKLHVPR